MYKLPVELVDLILHHLDLESLVRFARTCRYVHFCASQALALHQQRLHRYASPNTLDVASLLEIVREIWANRELGAYVRSVEIWRPRWRSSHLHSDTDGHGPRNIPVATIAELEAYESFLQPLLNLQAYQCENLRDSLRAGSDDYLLMLLFALAPNLQRLIWAPDEPCWSHFLCESNPIQLVTSAITSQHGQSVDIFGHRISDASQWNIFRNLRVISIGTSSRTGRYGRDKLEPSDIAPLFLLPSIRTLHFSDLRHGIDPPRSTKPYIFKSTDYSRCKDLIFHNCDLHPSTIASFVNVCHEMERYGGDLTEEGFENMLSKSQRSLGRFRPETCFGFTGEVFNRHSTRKISAAGFWSIGIFLSLANLNNSISPLFWLGSLGTLSLGTHQLMDPERIVWRATKDAAAGTLTLQFQDIMKRACKTAKIAKRLLDVHGEQNTMRSNSKTPYWLDLGLILGPSMIKIEEIEIWSRQTLNEDKLQGLIASLSGFVQDNPLQRLKTLCLVDIRCFSTTHERNLDMHSAGKPPQSLSEPAHSGEINISSWCTALQDVCKERGIHLHTIPGQEDQCSFCSQLSPGRSWVTGPRTEPPFRDPFSESVWPSAA